MSQDTGNKDAGNKKGMSDQNFQKFAAQLVSPSEVFEPRSARNRVNIPESLELLGSLASLTRSSLVRPPVETPALQTTAPDASSTDLGTSSTITTEPRVQYETSRKEYRQALEDQRITDALCKLQAHRESSRQDSQRTSQSNGPNNSPRDRSTFGKKAGSGAVLRPDQTPQAQSSKDSAPTTESATSGFQHASLPEVSVSVKPSPMRRSSGAFQSILRPSR
jgi:hypothetical protein